MKPYLHFVVWSLIALGTLAGFGYWYTVIADKSLSVATLQNQIDAKTAAIGRITSTRATLAELAGDEAIVQGYFVPETGVVPFIASLEARARAQGATLKVLSVATGGNPKQPTLVVTLAVDGAFDPVLRTIGAIEYAPYALSLSKLTLGENGKKVWHASLEIVVGSVSAHTASTTPLAAPKALSLAFSP